MKYRVITPDGQLIHFPSNTERRAYLAAHPGAEMCSRDQARGMARITYERHHRGCVTELVTPRPPRYSVFVGDPVALAGPPHPWSKLRSADGEIVWFRSERERCSYLAANPDAIRCSNRQARALMRGMLPRDYARYMDRRGMVRTEKGWELVDNLDKTR